MKVNKNDFKKLRLLLKGHKISEPHFGDRVKTTVSKNTKKSLNGSLDKNITKYKKHSNISDNKSFKGTPQRCIDFSAYLSNIKQSRNKISNMKVGQKSLKSNTTFNSVEKSNKKWGSKTKLKMSGNKKSKLHDYKSLKVGLLRL